MTVERLTDVSRFYDLAAPMLAQREAENNFELGLAARLRNEPPQPEHFYAIVLDGDTVISAAMMTPPWPVAVSRGPDEAMDALAEYLHDHQIGLTEVCGPVIPAQRCAQTLARLRGGTAQVKSSMRIMQTQRVIQPRPATGAMRVAAMPDLELVIQWMDEFGREIGETHSVPRTRMEQRLKNGEYHLWEDPVAVSIAAWTGLTPNGVRINAVYTPRESRARGYASNLVAALTQKMFDEGRKFCFLYTDAANPTSNKIYQQIGYEFVCDWVNLRLNVGS